MPAFAFSGTSSGNRSSSHATFSGWRGAASLALLTVSLAGMQLTWTVELGYGTPYLLSLGMRRSLLSLVWLAGPLSGLIMQPLVGAFSDRCTARLGRRRPFMLVGSLLVAGSLLLIGWARSLADLLTSDTDKQATLAVWIAVLAFYLVDFAVNTVQASIRALIVDMLPAEQQEKGNAFAGAMIGIGSVAGYFLGTIDLVSVFPWLGNTQMKVFCVLAALALLLTVAATCVSVSEQRYTIVHGTEADVAGRSIWHSLTGTFSQLVCTMRELPRPIQRVCNAQCFAWLGWFPFLFYATSWVAELSTASSNGDGQQEKMDATRAGSFALLLYSLVSLVTACGLPLLVTQSATRQSSKQSSTAYGWISLRSVYTSAHLLYGGAMLATLLATHSITLATILIAICGVAWAVMMWAPFALIGEMIQQSGTATDDDGGEDGAYQRVSATADVNDELEDATAGESYRLRDTHPPTTELPDTQPPLLLNGRPLHECAGEILGIHNVYVVLPQFISSFTSSILFAIFDAYYTPPPITATTSNSSHEAGHNPAAIGWILRLGGLSVLYAAYLSTKIRSPTGVS